ncbi:ankyrin repeat domain-containing protein [Tsuneonella sp. SYSU-LHT278]|uniref:ankyrin repeat domain-containing protein n=1 Tax=Tsuneonella sediminis TaxID=3416089 RepID=UPI003F7B2298
MKRLLIAAAFAVLVLVAGQSFAPVAAPALAQADPFDTARYYIKTKSNAEALELVDSGAFGIDQANPEGWTLLHYAAEAGNLAMVKALLARGADPTARIHSGSSVYEVALGTMVQAEIAAAVEARTGVNPMKPAAAAKASAPAPRAAAATAPKAAPATKSPREKMCQQRWYSSQALCSDSTCKMREYRKWQTCLKTGSYY